MYVWPFQGKDLVRGSSSGPHISGICLSVLETQVCEEGHKTRSHLP